MTIISHARYQELLQVLSDEELSNFEVAKDCKVYGSDFNLIDPEYVKTVRLPFEPSQARYHEVGGTAFIYEDALRSNHVVPLAFSDRDDAIIFLDAFLGYH